MMERRIRQLRELLGERQLIYVGPRGADSLPLSPLGGLRAVFSLIAPASSAAFESCLEIEAGVRVDLNSDELDESLSAARDRQREALYSLLGEPSAVLPYQSTPAVSAGFSLFRETVLPLGLFWEKQACFDFKPWIEWEVGKLGVRTIPWEYVRSLNEPKVFRLLGSGDPLVIRSARSSGGAGLWLVRSPDELRELADAVSPELEELFCVAAFLNSSLPVNVNACVFRGGEVSIHGSSVQLIGVEVCTRRPLGYAGNDFGALRNVAEPALSRLDSMTRLLGSWLASQGFLGAFGLDALISGEDVYFVEINPRFQASSAIAARIDEGLSRSNQYFEHAAAFLGLPPACRLSLPEVVKRQPSLAHAVVYNNQDRSVCLGRMPAAEDCELRLLPPPEVTVRPNGALGGICFTQEITRNGRELIPQAENAARRLIGCFEPAAAVGALI